MSGEIIVLSTFAV